MLIFSTTKRFDRESKKIAKRGKDMEKLKVVVKLLREGKPLPPKYHNHKLSGQFKDCWECHIEPDWLLVYKKSDTHLLLYAMGSHSDLF